MASQFEGKDIIVFKQFDGMSTQYARHDLPETKAAWMENLQPIGPNNLLSVPAPKAPLHNIAGETNVKQYYFNFGLTQDYIICFCASGAAYAVTNPGGVQTKIANSGTFSTNPDCTQWGTQRILVADSLAGYWTWDTHTSAGVGGVSPNIEVTAGGSGYTGGATVAISGGSGSGATATATVVGGIVTGVTLTGAGTGYLPGDSITVTITPVSGGSGATATAHVWPTLTPNPTTLAVAFGRVWLASGNVITYTGTGATYGGVGYDDFLSGDASGSTTIQDPDLVHTITALRSLNNYLFILGDGSVKQIGNVTVSGATTLFTLTTLSSDQGTPFMDTIVSYNRLLLFANTVGVFAVFGSSVEKISADMDGIFRALDFSQQPCAAVNDLNNIHVYLLLVRYIDPTAGARSLILGFMDKKWFVMSQGDNLKYIVSGLVSGVFMTYGTSTNDITPVLADPATAVSIKLSTSLTSHGQPFQGKTSMRYAVAQAAGASSTLSLLFEAERNPTLQVNYNVTNFLTFVGIGPIQFLGAGNAPLNFTTNAAAFFYKTGNPGSVAGVYLGMTLTGSVVNYTLNSMMLEFAPAAPFGSSAVVYGQAT